MSRSRPLTPEELGRMKIRPDILGKMIETRRITLGLSKIELSRRIGVDQQTISHWENGEVDATALRMINFVMAGSEDSLRDSWMRRALRAEGALKDIVGTIKEYRGTHQNDYHSQF